MSLCLLSERLPRLAERVTALPLGNWPTAVEPLAIDGYPQLFVKRDDLAGGQRHGGNKVRNLEWILGDAQRRGRRTLLTAAAVGSHWVRALTEFGTGAGFTVRAALYKQPMNQADWQTYGKSLATGAVLSKTFSYLDVPLHLLFHSIASIVRGMGMPLWVSAGGASAIGSLGYVQAALELREQIERGECPNPERIYCAAGSCGTLVGLAEGLAFAGIDAELIGIRVVPRIVTRRARRRRMHQRLRALLAAAGAELGEVKLPTILDGHAGRGYAHATEEGQRARARLAQEAEIFLDDTYTAKACAGMLAHIDANGLQERSALFIHTYDSRGAVEIPTELSQDGTGRPSED